jgi:hypothetical protein
MNIDFTTVLPAVGVVASGGVLAAGLAGSSRRGRDRVSPSTMIGSQLYQQVDGAHRAAAIVFGVAGLWLGVLDVTKAPVIPMPFTLLIAAFGLVSVVMSVIPTQENTAPSIAGAAIEGLHVAGGVGHHRIVPGPSAQHRNRRDLTALELSDGATSPVVALPQGTTDQSDTARAA